MKKQILLSIITILAFFSVSKAQSKQISRDALSGKGLTFENDIIWYDSQGLVLRSEMVKGLLEPRVEEFREVVTYEYDPKDLKIEAPIK